MSMPTTKVTFNIQSLREIENMINLPDFPAEGLPVCSSRLGLEVKHIEKQIVVDVKVLASYEGRLVMSYVVEGKFGFEDIAQYFDFDQDQITDKVGILPTLVGIVVDALRGMQALRLSETPYYAVLPYINPTQLLEATHSQKK